MSFGDTETTVELSQCGNEIIFHIEYSLGEELDEEGEGDWEHNARITAIALKGDVSFLGEDLVVKDIKSFSVTDGSFSNSVLGEAETVGAGDFNKWEVLEIIRNTVVDDDKEFLLEVLKE